jgi:hypothetical protein
VVRCLADAPAGRFAGRYRTFILLVAAYLIMRAVFAWLQRR